MEINIQLTRQRLSEEVQRTEQAYVEAKQRLKILDDACGLIFEYQSDEQKRNKREKLEAAK